MDGWDGWMDHGSMDGLIDRSVDRSKHSEKDTINPNH